VIDAVACGCLAQADNEPRESGPLLRCEICAASSAHAAVHDREVLTKGALACECVASAWYVSLSRLYSVTLHLSVTFEVADVLQSRRLGEIITWLYQR
jgi:hypothetical protein